MLSNRDKRKIKNGRGRGAGRDYQPYIRTQEFRSVARRHRIKGVTTGRLHHLMSDLETNVFRIYDWSPTVVDIWEQYSLDLEETLVIAKFLNIPHPTIPKTKQSIVMTTDFVISVKKPYQSSPTLYVRTVKWVSALYKPRTLEKFEIERLYFQRRGIDWGIITERDFNFTLAKNLQSLRPYYYLDEFGVTQTMANSITEEFTPFLNHPMHLSHIAKGIDKKLNIPIGTSLTVAYHKIITHQWKADLKKPIKPNCPILIHSNK